MSRFRYFPAAGISPPRPVATSVATLAAAALLASACAGGDAGDSAGAAAAPPSVVEQEAAARDEAGAPLYGADGADGAAQRPTDQVTVVPTERAIVYTGDMTVRAKDVTSAADKAKQIVTAAEGYLASEESSSFSPSEGSATLVFKIPPARYTEVLTRFGTDLGTRESMRQGTEDVTEQVADVNSRLASAKSALDSLRVLLKKANTIGEVLEVEREIAGRQAELESLQARQKTLAAATGMATLTLRLIGPVAQLPQPDDEPSGFLGGLRAGWDALVGALMIVLTVTGVLLPWLIVIVPVWLLVLLVLRRNRRKGPGTASPVPAAPGTPPRGGTEPSPAEPSPREPAPGEPAPEEPAPATVPARPRPPAPS